MNSRLRTPDAWWTIFEPNPHAAMRLVCFPFAGASPAIFGSWPAQLPADVELAGIQLPGRGSRVREAAVADLPSLVADLANAIPRLLDRPFAFFGHSLGAVISFEVCRWLRRHGRALPERLFVSGRGAPHIPSGERSTCNTSDAEFTAHLRTLNGTPAEVLDDPELLRLVLPALRADFTLSERYACAAEPPLACPITAFGGADDDETGGERLDGWRRQTLAAFALHVLPGDHFFLRSSERALLRILCAELAILGGRASFPSRPARAAADSRDASFGRRGC